MSRVKESFGKLSKIQKIEAIAAAALTISLMAAIPAYAWFALTHKAETMTKVQEPKNLDIRAGNAEAVEYFDLNDIDIESITPETPQRYVFCVVTENPKTYYDIQIAHTTNIPFSYTLYRAETGSISDSGIVAYTTHTNSPETIYYKRNGTALTLEKLNEDDGYSGRKLGKNGDVYYDLVYNENDEPEIYAVAKYEQVKELETRDPDHDFYILELGIDTTTDVEGFKTWNTAEKNNKETDIIYITASRTIK